MRIYVLGAGKMGLAAARDLLDREVSPEVSAVTMGDSNSEALGRLSGSLKDDRLKTEEIDVTRPDAVARRIDGFDSVVNTTWYNFNLQAMEASLTAGVDYTDLGGLYHMTLKQLMLHDKFVKAGVSAAIGCGSSPGTTNVLAAYAANMLDTVHEIRIRFSSKPLGSGEFLFPYSARTILDECTMQPAVFRNGRTIFVEPFSEPEKMIFPEPVGQLEEVYHCIHSEIATLPLTYRDKGIKNVSFKQSIGGALTEPIKAMIQVGMTSKSQVRVKGADVAPIDVLYHCLDGLPPPTQPSVWGELVSVVGTKNGDEVETDLQSLHTPDMPQAKYDPTGVAASIVGQMLARGEIEVRGVLAPEAAVNPTRYLEELAKRNITYDLVVKRHAK